MFRFVPNDLVDPSSSVGIIGIARRFIPPASFFRHFRRSRPRMMNALSTEGRGIVERVEGKGGNWGTSLWDGNYSWGCREGRIFRVSFANNNRGIVASKGWGRDH